MFNPISNEVVEETVENIENFMLYTDGAFGCNLPY
jgi:hypothetical protein